jgi:hypothetical protein
MGKNLNLNKQKKHGEKNKAFCSAKYDATEIEGSPHK